MTHEHPNITLFKRLDLRNLAGASDMFAENFVLHFFNPLLPDVEGDYAGVSGFQALLGKMFTLTDGTFEVQPISVTAVGDELLVQAGSDDGPARSVTDASSAPTRTRT